METESEKFSIKNFSNNEEASVKVGKFLKIRKKTEKDELLDSEESRERVLSISKNIDNIISEFEGGNKDEQSFLQMMKKFDALHDSGYFDSGKQYEIQKAWRKDQVEKVVEIFDENAKKNEKFEGCKIFDEVLAEGEARELFAQAFIKKIEGGKKISSALRDGIISWSGDNLEYLPSDTASDFLIAVLNNPNQMPRSSVDNILHILNIENDEYFVEKLKNELDKNKNDVYKSLRIIETLNYFKDRIDEKYFKDLTVESIVNDFKKNNDNFFINFKSEQILEFYFKEFSIEEKRHYLEEAKKRFFEKSNGDKYSLRYGDLHDKEIISLSDEEINKNFELHRIFVDAYLKESENLKRKDLYDDKDIRERHSIAPLSGEDYYLNEEEAIKDFCYAKISDKYGIIYTPEGGVDSFFELNKEGDGEGRNLGINEVLAKEGFEKENIAEEEYKKTVLTYKTLIELPMREKIENEFGIELKNFNIREQVQFVNFLSSKSVKEVEKVKEFLDQSQDGKAKNNRIKSFLSLESGEEMGNKILNIGEKLDTESADAVFVKYAEIISLADKSREDLEEIFKDKKEVTEAEREKIIHNLIGKGNQLLVDFSDRAETKKEDKESVTVLEELEKAKADLIFMASILKTLKKEENRGDIDIENFKGVTFEKRTINELAGGGKIMGIIDRICGETGKTSAINLSETSVNEFFNNKTVEADEKDKEKTQIAVRMMQIYYDNYRDAPEMQKILVEKFEKLLREGKDNTDIYALLKDGLPYAFCRFDDLGNETKYAASLNVDSKMQDSAIGKAFFEKCMEDNKKYTILGECSLAKPLVCTHIEKNGFVAYEVFDFSGELSVKIEKPGENEPDSALLAQGIRADFLRNDSAPRIHFDSPSFPRQAAEYYGHRNKKTYYYKGLDKKEIIVEYEKNFSDNKYGQNDLKIILKFEADSKNLYETIENLLNSRHYILTRYFAGNKKNDGGKREVYCAFERETS